MKIGIVTIIDYINYGNRLQNYAVQRVLNNMGYETESIQNIPYNDIHYISEGLSGKDKIRNDLRKIQPLSKVLFLKTKLGYIWRSKKTQLKKILQKNKSDRQVLFQMREERFREFNTKYIKESSFCLSEVDMSQKELDDFDYFVTGSDQVWNPLYKRGNAIYFLQFAPKEKRIALSASFGISEYPSNRLVQLRKYLEGIDYISVREERAKEIVEENSSKKATVLIDPTLMLERSEWEEIAKAPEFEIPEKYVMTFFLGGMSEETKTYIYDLAKQHGDSVVSLLDIEQQKYFTCNPSEFIYLIKNAQKVYTDSFHASVFSIIFHTNFQVFRRNGSADMFSRIETLMGTFGLESCICDKPYTDHQISQEMFQKVDEILCGKREEALCWIKGVIK